MSSLDYRAAARQPAGYDHDPDGQPSAELLERRWFAALAATRSLRAECDLLFEALMLSDAAWRRTCAQLAEFEALRDALELQMCAIDAPPAERRESRRRPAMSAA